MTVQNTKFRHLTIIMQLLAGLALLIVSYLTTEAGWVNQFVHTAMYSELHHTQNLFTVLQAGLSC